MAKLASTSKSRITTASTAEYFSKNLQQVGFSSSTKAVLTTLKEAVDNALDACEDAGILPEIRVKVERLGSGTLKNTDQILIRVEDNGPGIDPEDVPKVFGEYLASSKFGRGRCSRGQQGIGISAATTWAMQTTATGARIITKRKTARKAFSCIVDIDLRNNRGSVRDKSTLDWDRVHGTSVEFRLDGRIQLNGEGGLLNYLRGTVLVNPHATIYYDITEAPRTCLERVTQVIPKIPSAIEPHPHTMKFGEFMSHARLFGRVKTSVWLKKGFSRVNEKTLSDLIHVGKLEKKVLDRNIDALHEDEFRKLYSALQNIKLMSPSTGSVLAVGEDGLALSIRRMGDIDFFSVLTRKPTICDFKPIQVEVAIARLREKNSELQDSSVQVLRFANRVPLQFDKAACAIVKGITSINWRTYGLKQPKDALPLGPYIVAVSVVSPFIKFKNASKETIDASEELVEEMRRALIQAGQRLSRYIKREHKADELEERVAHIEQFGPILIETLGRILHVPESRKTKASEGLAKILDKDTKGIVKDLKEADARLTTYIEEKKQRLAGFFAAIDSEEAAAQTAVDAADRLATEPTKLTEIDHGKAITSDETDSKKRRRGHSTRQGALRANAGRFGKSKKTNS